MKADSNAIIHPSTKGGNLPQPFTNLQEIDAFNFKHLRTFLTFFEEDRDTFIHCYEIKVNVQTQLTPSKLDKKLQGFLKKA